MTTTTDEYKRGMLQNTGDFSVLIQKKGSAGNGNGVEKIVWEHGRRSGYEGRHVYLRDPSMQKLYGRCSPEMKRALCWN